MKIDQTELEVNGVKYVRADSVATSEKAETLDGLPYVIVRTYSAGVFAGYLKSRNGKEVTMLKARRLWYWSGAASLSQLSVDGSSDESSCKFPCEVESIELTEAIEILPCTEKARLSIKNVSVWKQ
jgi:hypothetical protein